MTLLRGASYLGPSFPLFFVHKSAGEGVGLDLFWSRGWVVCDGRSCLGERESCCGASMGGVLERDGAQAVRISDSLLFVENM